MMEYKTAEPAGQYDQVDRSSAIPKAVRSLKLHLTPSQKKRMWMQMMLIFASAIFDVFGLASILPIVRLAGEPAVIHNYASLEWVYQHLHFSSDKSFLLFMILGVLLFFIAKSAFGVFVNYLQV